jgi:hypothetical protein
MPVSVVRREALYFSQFVWDNLRSCSSGWFGNKQYTTSRSFSKVARRMLGN